jgi:hypothetical protein
MSKEPLPDFADLDLAELAGTSAHPTLAVVATELLAWWPTADEAVAAFEDTPKPPARTAAGARARARGGARYGPDGP